MSTSILDQLEAKPVPQKQQQIRVLLPQEGQVAIKAPIADLREEGYDRAALRKRLKNSGIIVGLVKGEEVARPTPKVSAPDVTPSGVRKPRRKIKKLGRIRIVGNKKKISM